MILTANRNEMKWNEMKWRSHEDETGDEGEYEMKWKWKSKNPQNIESTKMSSAY